MDSIEQKANELVDKFRPYSNAVYLPNDKFVYKAEIETKNAKQCALICVDQFIEYLKPIDDFTKTYRKELPPEENISLCDYWQKVKERLLAKQ